jgi:hypothetical protein
MKGLSASELADLGGVTEAEVQRLVHLGILEARHGTGPFLETDVHKVRLATACSQAGPPMDGIAAVIRAGRPSFAFLEAAPYRRWRVRSGRTYRQVSHETGVPLEQLGSFLEAIGSPGWRPTSRCGRTSWRWCRCCSSACPAASWTGSGRPGSAAATPRACAWSPRSRGRSGMRGSWRPCWRPALAILVNRSSREHGGVPVKWLGDGVMVHFRDPAGAVLAALQLLEQLPEAGLPPAHVGVAAGPVVVQGGDYFGRTVNLAARIAAYASASRVLVSERVAERAPPRGVTFVELGAVQLQGITNAVRLLEARRA